MVMGVRKHIDFMPYTQQIHKIVITLPYGRNIVWPMYNVAVTLMQQRQIYSIVPTFPQRLFQSSTHNIFWMLYWQRSVLKSQRQTADTR